MKISDVELAAAGFGPPFLLHCRGTAAFAAELELGGIWLSIAPARLLLGIGDGQKLSVMVNGRPDSIRVVFDTTGLKQILDA